MNVVFDRTEEVARNIHTFWFKPEVPVRYIAGQFTELYLPYDHADKRGMRHWFTLSSSPTEELLGITTKFTPQDNSTFKQQLAKLPPGAKLQLAEPMGDFVLPKDPSIPLVFVAGGMGITPVRSMIKWLHDTGEKRSIHLLYAVTHADELAFLPLFSSYSTLHLTPIVKKAPAGFAGHTGSISTERILELAPIADNAFMYLSGPEPMVEIFFKELQTQGIDSERLVTDYFPGYQKF